MKLETRKLALLRAIADGSSRPPWRIDAGADRRTLDPMCRARTVVSIAIAAVASAIASTGRAADICAETVPANRFIDGFPAYAQCAGSMTGAVYSNNGIDTSTTSGGADWVRTQRSGGYQCTELAHRYLTFKWNIQSVPNGDAGVWCDATLPAGLVKATTPMHGDLIVLAPGSCGADATTGHVAVIDLVNADSSVMAVQQNMASRSKYNASCAACFLHVVANDGRSNDGGVPPADAGGAGGRGGTGATPGAGGTTGAGGGAGAIGTGRGGDGAPPTTDGAAGASAGTGGTGPSSNGAAGTIGGGPGGTGGGPGATNDGASGGCSVAGARRALAPFGLLLAFGALSARRRRRAR